jgi:hypothetical protein
MAIHENLSQYDEELMHFREISALPVSPEKWGKW